MQMKESAKKILCIRNIYSPEKGRGIASTVASIDKYTSSTADLSALAPDLTPEELEQLKTYLINKENDLRETVGRVAARQIETQLEEANTAINNGFVSNEDKATAIYQQMDALAKTLKSLGYKKTELLKKAAFKLTKEKDGE